MVIGMRKPTPVMDWRRWARVTLLLLTSENKINIRAKRASRSDDNLSECDGNEG